MTKRKNYQSIYEYMKGQSASSLHPDLGLEIYKMAKRRKVSCRVKQVPWNDKNEDGSKRIMTYPKDFLESAFNNRNIKKLIK